MNNPLNTIKNYIKQQGNPRDLLINFMTQNNQNPMINNLIGMAKNGDNKAVEKFARNIFKEQGRDFDKEFSSFMQNFKR
jgi:hypothetical protein